MKKSQLQEKVQKHIDELFLNLSQNLGIDVSENVKKRFYQSLYNEAVASIQKQLRESVMKETENMFFCLETDLNVSFKEQTKKDLLATLLVEVLEAEESNSSECEAKKVDVNEDASNEQELQQVAPQEVAPVAEEAEVEKTDTAEKAATEEGENQAALQKGEMVAKKSQPKKYWTEQCDDSDIINRVNKIIRDKFDFSDSLTRDSNFRNDLGADSIENVEIIMEFEKEFGISLPDDIALGVPTVGDAYDAVWYFLKKKNHR